MAEILLKSGADIDAKQEDKTLLMKFWSLSLPMTDVQKSLNLEVIKVGNEQLMFDIVFDRKWGR